MKTLSLTLLFITVFSYTIKSQTVAFDTVSVNPLEICLGDCVELYAAGEVFTGNAQTILSNNFNDTIMGAGWYSQNEVLFDNPCNTAVDSWNGTTYLWFGNDTLITRDLYSPKVSITDSSTICFELRLAEQGDNYYCEGPDEFDEGVSFQYQVLNDTNWYDITYFCPDGNQYPTNQWIGQSLSGGGTGTPFNEWAAYCYNIPQSAYSDSTQFRWHQEITDTTFDHWGLDNILVYTGTLSHTLTWFDENDSIIFQDTGSFQKCPTQTTNYTAVISNGVFSSAATFSVFVSNLANDVSLSGVSITPDTVNLGDTVLLYGLLNDTVTYTNNDVFLLPGGSGQDTTSLLYINTMGVVNNIDNIGICMDVEHSYAGDLQISIICPSGQEMMLFDGYGSSNIGGEYLGEPTDQTSNPGNPYTYCWNSSATNGTMEDMGANAPTYSYIDNDTNTVTNHEYIPGGTYESSGNWSSLIGCPYNGAWTLHIIDNMGADDGYIFGWDIGFNNLQLNTSWQGENTFYPTNDTAFAVPTTMGWHPYVYTLENDLGCNYDTTLYVFVTDPIDTLFFVNNNEYNTPVDTVQMQINECSYDYYTIDSANVVNYVYNGNYTTDVTIYVYHEGTYTEYTQQVATPDTGTYQVQVLLSCTNKLNENVVVVITDYFYADLIMSSEIMGNNNFKIYPNPANNHITIESTEIINSIEILSVTGSIIKQLTIEQLNNLIIDITTLKKGIYFIKINDNKIIKFVKQ